MQSRFLGRQVVGKAAVSGLVFFGKNAAGVADKIKPKPWTAVLFAGAMLWCVLAFSGVSTFLYFNF